MKRSVRNARVSRELEKLAEVALSEDELALLRLASDRWRRFHGFTIESWLHEATSAQIAKELIAADQNKALEVADAIRQQVNGSMVADGHGERRRRC